MTVSAEVNPGGVNPMIAMAAVAVVDDVNLRLEFAQYLVHECGLSPSTAFTYEQSLKRGERFFARDALEVSFRDLRRFMRSAPYSSATLNSTLVAFKAFDRFLVLEGLRQPSAISALKGPKIIRIPKRPLSPEEARVVLDTCSRADQFRGIWLPLFAGLRVAEAASIHRQEWERPAVLRFVGKGRKPREVPVHPELLVKRGCILEVACPTNGLKSACRALSHVIGIPFSPHILRHTFSIALRDAGVKREVIGALLGHAPLSVTETYAEVSWQEKVEAISRLAY